jgi:hypothetical protein
MTTIEFPLDRGERLLWAGTPRHGVVFRASDLFQVPFSLLWAGFALFWNLSVWASDAPVFFRLWGLPFLVVGAYVSVGRFWVDARRRARTTYGVTDRRVVIASGVFTPALKSLDLQTLSDVTLAERPDGAGTITFGAGSMLTGMYAGTPWPGMTQPPAFELIPDARRVYTIVRDAQAASRAPAA